MTEDLNFKKRFMDTVTRITDAPDNFLLGAYYFVISSTIGKFFYCPEYPRPINNPFRPNLWVILSGKSGVTRKSTTIDLALYTIKGAFYRYYENRLRLPKNAIMERINTMIIEGGSPEGIIEHIASVQDVNEIFILFSHEFGGILQQMKAKEYMTGYASLLSTLYSGEERVFKLVKKTRFIRAGLYVTAVFGIQEPWLYMDNMIFRQGLMRRVLLIYAKQEDKTRWLPPLDVTRSVYFDQLEILSSELGDYIIELEGLGSLIEVNFDPVAKNMINEYARRMEQQYGNEYSAFSYYVQTSWDILTRLSVLEAISSRKPEEKEVGPTLTVLPNDVREAMNFLESTLPRAREAIVRTEAGIKSQPVYIDTAPLELIYTIIEEAGPEGITATELLKQTKILKDKLKKYIMHLMEEKKIVAIVKKKRRGRPTLIFYSSKYINQALQVGETLSPKAIEVRW